MSFSNGRRRRLGNQLRETIILIDPFLTRKEPDRTGGERKTGEAAVLRNTYINNGGDAAESNQHPSNLGVTVDPLFQRCGVLLEQMCQLGAVGFPILPVEGRDVDFFNGAGVEATRVDAVAVGIGSWDIKRFDAANLAKQMLGHSGVDSVSREMFPALN